MPGAVTPCMGVWIETPSRHYLQAWCTVTPCMGVWIETLIAVGLRLRLLSHPVWVCGLKRICAGTEGKCRRHTLYGCVD